MIQFKPEDYLISLKDRPLNNEGLFGEEILLNNPLIDILCERMRNEYVPQHKFALFSLCTKTRPYMKSKKWQYFNMYFGNYCDFIVCSNGGIIPIEYQYCYPFQTYNAPATKKCDELYKQKFKQRLDLFLEKHMYKWDKIIFTFLPNSRNRQVVQQYESNKIYVIPSMEVYNDIQINGSPRLNTQRYPQCANQHINEIFKILGVNYDI